MKTSVISLALFCLPLMAGADSHTGVGVMDQPGASIQQAPYLSGGIGLDERRAMQARRGDYNLNLTFAEEGGALISDISVQISDAAGHLLLDTVTDGPLLYAKLPPGRYRVEAQSMGLRKQRQLTLTPGARINQTWFWPK